MDIEKLYYLLKKEEGFKLDFKLKLSLMLESEKKEFVKDAIAMANTEGGRGYIIYGVQDKTKKIIGIEDIPEEIEEKVQQIIANRSMPPVSVQFDCLEIGEKTVGVLTIFKSRQIPHQMKNNGSFYVRRGSTTDVATRHEIASMLQKYGIVSFETVPCRSACIKDLNAQEIERAIGTETFKGKNMQMLIALGVITKVEDSRQYYPTYGGLLVFGDYPQRFMPHATLRIYYKGEIISIEGSILKMLKYFEEQIKNYVSSSYPIEALEEIVALLHRDYWNVNYGIEVKITEDTIVVSNPSNFIYRKGKDIRYRANPWLYSRLLLLGVKEQNQHFGIGLDKAINRLGGYKKVHIENDLREKIFKVTIPKEDIR